jgi:squalene-hopene/tetraprenyl-beta-curcumene cyclase
MSALRAGIAVRLLEFASWSHLVFPTIAVTLLIAATQVAPATSSSKAPPSPYDAPAAPLDQRVDPSKITTSSQLPRLPDPVAQPLRVMSRIATTPEAVPMDPQQYRAARAAIDRGLAFLRTSQRPSGAWMEKDVVQPTDQPRAASAAIAVTAMGAKAFVQAAADDEAARKALGFVATRVRDVGFDKLAESGVGTYLTSAVVSAFAISEDPRFTDEIHTALQWLRTTQWDQSEGIQPTQDWFGGSGYGRGKRPDLSNTQFMLDALHDAGVSPDDPAVQKALAFVSRAQNLPAHNDASWAQNGAKLDREGASPAGSSPGSTSTTSGTSTVRYADGGFIYSPANGGESFASDKAGEGRNGEKMPPGHRSLRSYGSMTYAGFKSLLYAGLSRDDERVKAAFEWISLHYTFDENPGLGQEGLYYYYHAMSRALLAGQQTEIPAKAADGSVSKRNWRDDLVAALVKRQAANGSWVNTADRWEETQPDLVTIYAVLALEEALKPVLQTE